VRLNSGNITLFLFFCIEPSTSEMHKHVHPIPFRNWTGEKWSYKQELLEQRQSNAQAPGREKSTRRTAEEGK
jgi:hypothetical protein